MRPTQRLDHFLPVRFRNGTLVKQFSKPCVRCGRVLHAADMHGIARLLGSHLALAAQAECPACQARFPVTCVVDDKKRVRRLGVPHFLLSLYLRLLPDHPDEGEAREAAAAQAAREEAAAVAVAPVVDYPRADVALGSYQGKPIPAHIVVDGREVPFDRVEPGGRVAPGEYLLDGCFVYKSLPR
ncbi:hypothetical protein [Chitinimonas koreensis]|uniref:hypothetical protein n=1 Tax=Chitinimonas koreensis TaxID=356302 RepID=UPI00041596BF|nr:hypothetical protein [Chitinimonas koreensis]QNM96830.1 hypothetical protein H9L41_00250 [Chitinimonas koreensis]